MFTLLARSEGVRELIVNELKAAWNSVFMADVPLEHY